LGSTRTGTTNRVSRRRDMETRGVRARIGPDGPECVSLVRQ